jgi:hypothetical protein
MLPTFTAVPELAEITAALPIESQIELFLSGVTDGGPLLGALYDDVLDEPVPDRLRALCRTV